MSISSGKRELSRTWEIYAVFLGSKPRHDALTTTDYLPNLDYIQVWCGAKVKKKKELRDRYRVEYSNRFR